MSERSPGPWRVVEAFGDEWFEDARGMRISMSDPENHRLVEAAPEMLEFLRDAGQWYCGELPDGTDRREAIAALLARIDG